MLEQTRMCLDLSYGMLHRQGNNDLMLSQLPDINDAFGKEHIKFEYPNIYENVSKLSEAMLPEINDVIVELGHRKVFKKNPIAIRNG